jgi:hypothetical protein
MPSPWRLILVPFCALALPAEAGECLRSVDNMIVVYALPASPQFVAPEASRASQVTAPNRLAEYETRYFEPGRVMPHAQPRPADLPPEVEKGEQQTPMPLPELSASVPPLSAEQRRKLQEALYTARDAEASGDEGRCQQLLENAKAVVAAPPPPPARPQRGAKKPAIKTN